MKTLILFPALLFLFCTTLWSSPFTFNVAEYGIKNDGITVNTSKIQSLIDECEENGGGTIYFPVGEYVTGTLYMKNNVHLYLENGAVILGSTSLDDYPVNLTGYVSRADRYNARALFWAEGAQNIALRGYGTIDGRGESFKDNKATAEEIKTWFAAYEEAGRYLPAEGYANRPYLIRFISCSNVLVENLHLRNSGMWMQHYQNCDDVTLRGLNIFNHACPNSDMFDIDGCRNVLISDCTGDSGDDAVTLKSTGATPTENVTITNCILRTHCNFIKTGTESFGGFKNITVTNCVLEPSKVDDVIFGRREGLAGIALECVDGGILEQVTISNITMRGMTVPLFIRLGNRGRLPAAEGTDPEVGKLRNVVISDIVATGLQTTGASITGIPGHPVQNVILSNLQFYYTGGGSSDLADRVVPEKEDAYPESHMFGQLPAYALYGRHIDKMMITNMITGYDKPEGRPAIILDDVTGYKTQHLDVQKPVGSNSALIIRNSAE